MYSMLPFVLTLATFLLWMAAKLICRRRQISVRLNTLVSFYLFAFLCYPQITQECFDMLDCVSFENGKSYLKSDLSIECWDTDHKRMALSIGLPLIFMWTLLFPLLIYLKLRRIRSVLDNQSNLQVYGLFYVGLTDQSYFWEVVVVNLRKLVFIISSTLMATLNPVYKVKPSLIIFFRLILAS